VLANLVTTDYSGEAKLGNTVRVNRVGRVTVADYDPATTNIVYQVPTNSTQVIPIDTRKYFAFQVDDLDALQSNVTVIDEYTKESAYSLADQVDQSLATLYTAAGAGDVAVDLTAAGDMYGALVKAGQKLSEQNVPTTGRWVVISPAAYAALLGTNSKLTQASETGSSVAMSGSLGMVAGFNVFMSNNLVDADATAVIQRKCLYGYKGAIAHARALEGAPELIRLESKFASAIRGNMVWGNKVIEPLGLGTLTVKEA
jgi:P22 coat protein - gene protein 5